MADIDGHLLTAFDDVIARLGGVKHVCLLTATSRTAVWKWRKRQRFPARQYYTVCKALALRGCRPDLRLFNFSSSTSLPIDDVAAA